MSTFTGHRPGLDVPPGGRAGRAEQSPAGGIAQHPRCGCLSRTSARGTVARPPRPSPGWRSPRPPPTVAAGVAVSTCATAAHREARRSPRAARRRRRRGPPSAGWCGHGGRTAPRRPRSTSPTRSRQRPGRGRSHGHRRPAPRRPAGRPAPGLSSPDACSSSISAIFAARASWAAASARASASSPAAGLPVASSVKGLRLLVGGVPRARPVRTTPGGPASVVRATLLA